jgi:hypothetical protein
VRIRGLLAADINAVVPDDILLAKHAQEQRVLVFVVKSADPLRHFWK